MTALDVQIKLAKRFLLSTGMLAASAIAVVGQMGPTNPTYRFETPPQDRGIPYTQSSRPRAVAAIHDYIAVFGGSRYAYLYGHKVRLDDNNMLHAEAILQNGKVFVPQAFASALRLTSFKGVEPPSYIRYKWVDTFPRNPIKIATSIPTMQVNGESYFSLADLAQSMGLQTHLDARGLLLISRTAIAYKDSDGMLTDCVVTLFDTPEKLADPQILIKYVPVPHAVGNWYEHAAVTPEQMKQLNKPETQFPLTPKSAYDLTGVDMTVFGSKVPAPGVFPRVVFSPEDIPALAARIQSGKFGQMSMIEIEEQFKHSWWDDSTSDGRLFRKLSTGDIADLKFDRGDVQGPFLPYASGNLFAGFKPDLFNTHISYVTNALVTMSFYALLTKNDDLGRKCAASVANFYKILEPTLDQAVAMTNSELGSDRRLTASAEDSYRGLHGLVEHMDLGLSLDFAGKWMTPDQLEIMRRFITKATYGRRVYGGEAPSRWRDNNQVTWHTTNVLAQMAIEGLPGYDPEVYQGGLETVQSFLEFGIDENGQFFESNGKTGGGDQFLFLTMMGMARRGENFFGHPHLRKVLAAEVYNISPSGSHEISGGTFSGSRISPQFIAELADIYPRERTADFLLTGSYPNLNLKTVDLRKYRDEVAATWNKRRRLPGPTYPGFVFAFPFCRDFESTTRADLKLPLDRNDPIHGVFGAFSDQTPDAAWINMQVRPNHYIGAGHHHADAGMFYFSGAGVDWITESPFDNTYDGRLHNEVLIDGISEANGTPARAKYIGATLTPEADFASADLSYAYSWQWTTQVSDWPHTWPTRTPEITKWELEPAKDIIAIFQGTQRYKNRIWWDTYLYTNWIPTLRAPFNPVEYAYRTTGLVRSKHPYAIVVDDLKKDGTAHLYQWTAMLPEAMEAVSVPGTGTSDLALVRKADFNGGKPTKGTPMLLVHLGGTALGLVPRVQMAKDGPKDRQGYPAAYQRIVIDDKTEEYHERVVLLPFRLGEALPAFNESTASMKLTWPDEQSSVSFTQGADHRSVVSLDERNFAGR